MKSSTKTSTNKIKHQIYIYIFNYKKSIKVALTTPPGAGIPECAPYIPYLGRLHR